MGQNQPANKSNVIAFPSRKPEVKGNAPNAPQGPQAPQMPVNPPPAPKPGQPRVGGSKLISGAAFAAIALASLASNRFAFTTPESSGRAIASVGQTSAPRDSQWEKNLAESLASSTVRDVASIGIGHAATSEEKLRWGTLEEKYTIVFGSDAHKIMTIELQDVATDPSYVLDRAQFLVDYGSLIEPGFVEARLKSVEMDHEKMIESYTIYGKDQKPASEARFEMDLHRRLLSLKVEPIQI